MRFFTISFSNEGNKMKKAIITVMLIVLAPKNLQISDVFIQYNAVFDTS